MTGAAFALSLVQFENCNDVLPPGDYIVMLDPIWNEAAHNNSIYKDVIVDLYGPRSAPIVKVDYHIGKQVFIEALKDAAQNNTTADMQKRYLAQKEKF